MKADEAQMAVKATEDSEEKKKALPYFPSARYAPPVICNRLHMYNQCHNVVLKAHSTKFSYFGVLIGCNVCRQMYVSPDCAQYK